MALIDKCLHFPHWPTTSYWQRIIFEQLPKIKFQDNFSCLLSLGSPGQDDLGSVGWSSDEMIIRFWKDRHGRPNPLSSLCRRQTIKPRYCVNAYFNQLSKMGREIMLSKQQQQQQLLLLRQLIHTTTTSRLIVPVVLKTMDSHTFFVPRVKFLKKIWANPPQPTDWSISWYCSCIALLRTLLSITHAAMCAKGRASTYLYILNLKIWNEVKVRTPRRSGRCTISSLFWAF